MKRYSATLLIAGGVVLGVAALWLGVHGTRKAEIKRYAMTGIVVAVNTGTGTASVHNDNIPGFMQPMEMDYRVRDKAVLSSLKRGDNIRATLVSDGKNWDLENVILEPSH